MAAHAYGPEPRIETLPDVAVVGGITLRDAPLPHVGVAFRVDQPFDLPCMPYLGVVVDAAAKLLPVFRHPAYDHRYPAAGSCTASEVVAQPLGAVAGQGAVPLVRTLGGCGGREDEAVDEKLPLAAERIEQGRQGMEFGAVVSECVDHAAAPDHELHVAPLLQGGILVDHSDFVARGGIHEREHGGYMVRERVGRRQTVVTAVERHNPALQGHEHRLGCLVRGYLLRVVVAHMPGVLHHAVEPHALRIGILHHAREGPLGAAGIGAEYAHIAVVLPVVPLLHAREQPAPQGDALQGLGMAVLVQHRHHHDAAGRALQRAGQVDAEVNGHSAQTLGQRAGPGLHRDLGNIEGHDLLAVKQLGPHEYKAAAVAFHAQSRGRVLLALALPVGDVQQVGRRLPPLQTARYGTGAQGEHRKQEDEVLLHLRRLFDPIIDHAVLGDGA